MTFTGIVGLVVVGVIVLAITALVLLSSDDAPQHPEDSLDE